MTKKIRVKRGLPAINIPSLPDKEVFIKSLNSMYYYLIIDSKIKTNDWGMISVSDLYSELEKCLQNPNMFNIRIVNKWLKYLYFIK